MVSIMTKNRYINTMKVLEDPHELDSSARKSSRGINCRSVYGCHNQGGDGETVWDKVHGTRINPLLPSLMETHFNRFGLFRCNCCTTLISLRIDPLRYRRYYMLLCIWSASMLGIILSLSLCAEAPRAHGIATAFD